jgi:hypothetical protein
VQGFKKKRFKSLGDNWEIAVVRSKIAIAITGEAKQAPMLPILTKIKKDLATILLE